MGDGNREFKEYVTLTHFSLLQVRQELEASKARVEGDMAAAEEARESFSVLAVEAMQEVRDKSEQTIKGLECEVEPLPPRQSLGRGCQKSIRRARQLFLKVNAVPTDGALPGGSSAGRVERVGGVGAPADAHHFPGGGCGQAAGGGQEPLARLGRGEGDFVDVDLVDGIFGVSPYRSQAWTRTAVLKS